MQPDVGAHLVCALNLVPETNSGAHEVRPYGNQFSFATYAQESHSNRIVSAELSAPAGGRR